MTTRLQQNLRSKIRQVTKIRYEIWLVLVATIILITFSMISAPEAGDVQGALDKPTAEELAASPAKKIASDIKTKYPNAVERPDKRTANSKTYFLGKEKPGEHKYAVDTVIGQVHYRDAQGNWQEIDKMIESDKGRWDWKMVKNSFEVHGKKNFTSNEIVEFKKNNNWLRLTPSTLAYSNDAGEVQPIASPQSVLGNINGNKIAWPDAYGSGLDFSWEVQSSRLAKLLTIKNKTNLPPALQSIKSGGNPVLELNLKLSLFPGVSLFIDGKEWKGKEIDFNGRVEFKDKQGDVVWSFDPPLSWDSSGSLKDSDPQTNQQLSTFRLRRVGSNLMISHRLPLSFVEKAVYPLKIDVTVDEDVPTGSDDVLCYGGTPSNCTSFLITYNYLLQGYYPYQNAMRFTTVAVPNAATITTAYLTLAGANQYTGVGPVNTLIHAENADNPGQVASAADYNSRSLTTGTAWNNVPNLILGTNYNSPEIKTEIQTVVNRGGWASNNAMNILWKENGTVGFAYRSAWSKDGNSGTTPPKLHIEYSVAAADISGNIYTDEGTTPYDCSVTNLTVNLKVNGAGTDTATCTAASGAYSITGVSAGTNDIITLYLDGETEKAVTVTKYNTGDMTDLHLYQNHVITRAETGSLTNTNMGQYDKDNDALDILFTANGGTLTVDDGQELYIWTGDTFAPGGNLTGIDDIKIVGTYTAAGTETITVSGSWVKSGTFNVASSTVTFDATTSTETITGTNTDDFYNIIFDDSSLSGIFQLASAIDINNDLTQERGTFQTQNYNMKVGGSWSSPWADVFTVGNSTITFDSTSTGKTIFNGAQDWNNLIFDGVGGGWEFVAGTNTLNGDFTINNGTFSDTGGVIVIVKGGDVIGNGVITFDTSVSTFALYGTGNFGGTSTWTFNSITFGDTTTDTTTSTGSGAITVLEQLTIAANQTLNAGSKTWVLSDSDGCPCTPFTETGTFTPSTSTFNYTATAATTVTATTYYNLGIGTTSDATAVTYSLATAEVGGVLTLGSAGSSATDTLAQTGTLTLSGGGTPIVITANGAFDEGTSTVKYTSTSATNIVAANITYNSLTLAPSDAGSPTYTLGTAGGQTLTVGTFYIGDGVNAVTVSNSSWSPNIIIGTSGNMGGRNFIVWEFAEFSGTGTGLITHYTRWAWGLIYIFGTLNLSGGNYDYRADNTTGGSAGIILGEGSITFNNLKLSNASTTTPKTHSLNNSPVVTMTVSGNFQIGDAGDAFSASFSGQTGTVNIGGAFTLPNGTFNPGTSTINLMGTVDVPAITYYNLQCTVPFSGCTMGTAASQTITVQNDLKVADTGGTTIIDSGTYSPTITIKTMSTGGSIWFDSSAGSPLWIVTGTGQPLPGTFGVFWLGAGTIFRFTGAGATTISALGYMTLESKPAGAHTHTVLNNTSVSENLVVGDGTNSSILSLPASPNNLTVTGNTTVDTNATISGAGTGTFTAKGNVSGEGAINFTGNTFKHRVAAAQNFGTTAVSVDWTFNNLEFSNSQGASNPETITLNTGGSGKIEVTGTLTVGPTADASTTTLDVNTNDRTLDVVNATIDVDGIILASNSAPFTVAGNWSNSGTFTANGGEVTFDDAGTTSTFSGTTTFYDLTSITPSKALTFTAGSTQSVTDALTINGGSCSTQIILRSSSTTQWDINVSGSSTADYVDVQDSNATGSAITANFADDSTGNTNWIFASGCGPVVDELMRHGNWFNGSGVEQSFTF